MLLAPLTVLAWIVPSAPPSEAPAAEAVVVVARAAWDPDPPRLRDVTRYGRPLKGALRAVVVHHSDFPDAPGPLGIKLYHLEISRFADIGYHFVVARDGTIYEGRPLHAMGAHAGQSREANRRVAAVRRGRAGGSVDEARRLDPDHGAVGVVLDGSFTHEEPPPAQWRALERLVAKLRADYDIPAENVVTHREVKERLVEARGLTFAGEETRCPGDALHRRVVLLRSTSR